MKNINKLAVVVALLAAATVAVNAGVRNEALVAASGGVSLTSTRYTSPPIGVDFATDGDASITFYWFGRDTYPYSRAAFTDSIGPFYLRTAYPPRHFDWPVNAGPDSVDVVLSTATEVIVSW